MFSRFEQQLAAQGRSGCAHWCPGSSDVFDIAVARLNCRQAERERVAESVR